jgi:hypothetical protein
MARLHESWRHAGRLQDSLYSSPCGKRSKGWHSVSTLLPTWRGLQDLLKLRRHAQGDVAIAGEIRCGELSCGELSCGELGAPEGQAARYPGDVWPGAPGRPLGKHHTTGDYECKPPPERRRLAEASPWHDNFGASNRAVRAQQVRRRDVRKFIETAAPLAALIARQERPGIGCHSLCVPCQKQSVHAGFRCRNDTSYRHTRGSSAQSTQGCAPRCKTLVMYELQRGAARPGLASFVLC